MYCTFEKPPILAVERLFFYSKKFPDTIYFTLPYYILDPGFCVSSASALAHTRG
jgi:hypothetical protein